MSFKCLECGYRFPSTRSAERAAFGDGCPGCGGFAIDLDPVPEREPVEIAAVEPPTDSLHPEGL